MNYVCAQCGHRQPDDVECRGCGKDVVHDIRERRTRDFLRDVEQRLERRRADRIRVVSVAVGVGVIVALLTTEFWWDVRRASIGLPLLLDQWIYAGLIAVGLMKLAEGYYADKKRFPFLAEAWDEDLES